MRRLEAKGLFLATVACLSLSAFDPAKDLVVVVQGGALSIRIPEGVHLKRNVFKVLLQEGPGKLHVGPLPPEDAKDDVGDPVWHGTVRVPLTGEGLADPVALVVTLQPCTEGKDGMCYLPQRRNLRVPRKEIQAPGSGITE